MNLKSKFGLSRWVAFSVPVLIIAISVVPCYLKTNNFVLGKPAVTAGNDSPWKQKSREITPGPVTSQEETTVTPSWPTTYQPPVSIQLQNSDLNKYYPVQDYYLNPDIERSLNPLDEQVSLYPGNQQGSINQLVSLNLQPVLWLQTGKDKNKEEDLDVESNTLTPVIIQQNTEPEGQNRRSGSSSRKGRRKGRRKPKANNISVAPPVEITPVENPPLSAIDPFFEALTETTEAAPEEKKRRRRITTRKRTKHEYLEPTPILHSESVTHDLVSPIEPFDPFSYGYQFGPYDGKKFWQPPPPAEEIPIDTERGSGINKEILPPTVQPEPKSNYEVVIYQRGSTAKVDSTQRPNGPNKIVMRRRKKLLGTVLHNEQPGDLHLSESVNPFVNASVPISNDLRDSLHFNLDILHPLLNSDTILKDSAKIPENKTVGIKHKLSDNQVSVKIEPGLHDKDFKNHFLNHDAIISSDYERQLYKNQPRIRVEESMSMSTSSTASSSSSSQQKRPGSHYQGSTYIPLRTTTPMPDVIIGKGKISTLPTSSTLLIQPSIIVTTSTAKAITRQSRPHVPTTTPSLFQIIDSVFTTTPNPFYTRKPTVARTSTFTSLPPFKSKKELNIDSAYKPDVSTIVTKAGSPTILTRVPDSTTIGTNSHSTPAAEATKVSTVSIPSVGETITLTTPPSKTQFILRPKGTTKAPKLSSTTSRPNASTLADVMPTGHAEKINTFLDNIDEYSGKNKWTPTVTPMTQPPDKQTTLTPAPDSRSQVNKDTPLILMPPFTNDKDRPSTFTTPKPVSTQVPNPDDAILQQLLSILNGDVGSTGAATSTRSLAAATSTSKATTVSSSTTTPKPTTKSTTKKPPRVRITPPLTTPASLFNLFDIFAPRSTVAPAVLRSPQTTTSNDFFNLFNLFQPTTAAPRPATSNSPFNDLFGLLAPPRTATPAPAGNNLFGLLAPSNLVTSAPTSTGLFGLLSPQPTPANNDLFGLLNLFQPASTTPAPASNDIFNIFNLFTQPTRAPTTTPAPTTNDIFGLLNLFGGSNTVTQAPGKNKQRPPKTSTETSQSELDALVQQALLESLGVKPNNNPFASQASNINQQLVTPANGLSDADLNSIYEFIDQQKDKYNTTKSFGVINSVRVDKKSNATVASSGSAVSNVTKHVTIPATTVTTTFVTTTPAPSTIIGRTTTLMPFFRNILNMVGITDPTNAPTSLTGRTAANASTSPEPVYNPLSTSTKSKVVNPEDLILEILTAEANRTSAKPTVLNSPSTDTVVTTSRPQTASTNSFDFLSQLLNFGHTVQASAKPNPVRVNKEAQNPFQLFGKPQQQQPAFDIQSILSQNWLTNPATTPRPEVAPSESNFLHVLANQFTPKPQKPNGLYYWVDMNAFLGDDPGNPLGGLRPKIGSKDYFIKVK